MTRSAAADATAATALGTAFAMMLLAPSSAVADDAAIRAAVARLVPEAKVESIRASALAGVAEVVVDGKVLYVSEDGRHLLHGALYDTTTRADLTEQTRARLRADALAQLPAEAGIRFAASRSQHEVTVFTAVDCGYCRRFHEAIDAHVAGGVAVNYVLIPLAGPGSDADRASARVHCAVDRPAAFTAATFGRDFDAPQCDSAYPHGVALAQALGIRSTPTIVAADGRVLGGYLTPEQLRAQLADGPR